MDKKADDNSEINFAKDTISDIFVGRIPTAALEIIACNQSCT